MAAILVVDSELATAAAIALDLTRAIHGLTSGPGVEVAAETSFPKARARLKVKPPDLLITALHLREYNGIHLVYLSAGSATKSIVHTDTADPVQAGEIRSAGAFYEVRSRLPWMLSAYAAGRLPPRDRRNSIALDRRGLSRGGRRTEDRPVAI